MQIKVTLKQLVGAWRSKSVCLAAGATLPVVFLKRDREGYDPEAAQVTGSSGGNEPVIKKRKICEEKINSKNSEPVTRAMLPSECDSVVIMLALRGNILRVCLLIRPSFIYFIHDYS
jgi:hypothetical protein